MKIKHDRGYYQLLEHSEMKSLHCKSGYAITFTFNHAPCNLVMEKWLKIRWLPVRLLVKMLLEVVRTNSRPILHGYLHCNRTTVTESQDADIGIGSSSFSNLSTALGQGRCCLSPYKHALLPYIAAELQHCLDPCRSGANLCTVMRREIKGHFGSFSCEITVLSWSTMNPLYCIKTV